MPYSGLFSLGANFLKFYKQAYNFTNFLMATVEYLIVGHYCDLRIWREHNKLWSCLNSYLYGAFYS